MVCFPAKHKKHASCYESDGFSHQGTLATSWLVCDRKQSAAKSQRADQMLLRMKKSWMKMQPNGRIPPIRTPGIVRMYVDWSGIWRGIWLVRTGCSIAWEHTDRHTLHWSVNRPHHHHRHHHHHSRACHRRGRCHVVSTMPTSPMHAALPSPNQGSVVAGHFRWFWARTVWAGQFSISRRSQNASLDSPVMILPGFSVAKITKKGKTLATNVVR